MSWKSRSRCGQKLARFSLSSLAEAHSMTRRAAAGLALLTLSLAASAPGLTARDKITLRVTPTVSRAPAYVNVIAQIERDRSNRTLEVTAESAEYYRKSTIDLDGEQAPRVTEISFKSLPSGSYLVSAVLVDDQGRKSVAQGTLLVVSSFGER